MGDVQHFSQYGSGNGNPETGSREQNGHLCVFLRKSLIQLFFALFDLFVEHDDLRDQLIDERLNILGHG